MPSLRRCCCAVDAGASVGCDAAMAQQSHLLLWVRALRYRRPAGFAVTPVPCLTDMLCKFAEMLVVYMPIFIDGLFTNSP